MIKTVFVPLMVKGSPMGDLRLAQRDLHQAMTTALAALDVALDDGYRIIAQQYIDSAGDSGTVFFIRDDADCLLITDEGLAALEDDGDPFAEMDVSAQPAQLGTAGALNVHNPDGLRLWMEKRGFLTPDEQAFLGGDL